MPPHLTKVVKDTPPLDDPGCVLFKRDRPIISLSVCPGWHVCRGRGGRGLWLAWRRGAVRD